MFGAHVVLLALQKPGLRHLFTVLRPNTGRLSQLVEAREVCGPFVLRQRRWQCLSNTAGI